MEVTAIINDQVYIDIAKNITIDKAYTFFSKKEPKILSVILYGSSAQPTTRHKASDIDIIVIIEDSELPLQEKFKFCYQNKVKTDLVDIKYYTEASFKKELYTGSFTRLFALLNAYRIIFDLNNQAKEIIKSAWVRMDTIVKKTEKDFALTDINQEAVTMQNYFSNIYNALNSEKLKDNELAINVSLFESCKLWLVQFQKLLFSKDLQSNPGLKIEKQLIMNLLLLNQTDGSRLLNYDKYMFDPRIKIIVEDINTTIKLSIPTRLKVSAIYNILNDNFVHYFSIVLLDINKPDKAYYSFQKI